MPGRGPSKRVRPATADKLLTVTGTMQAGGARVPAGPTWKIIATLLDRGWTKAAISRAIGQDGRALQLSRRSVTAGNARAVKALLDQPVPPRRSRFGLHPQPQIDKAAERRDALRRLAEREARAHYRALARIEAEPETIDYELPVLADATRPWMRTAPCRRPEVPSWLFFPAPSDTETIEAARAVCATCPHAAKCAEAGVGEEGVWGGLTEDERQAREEAA